MLTRTQKARLGLFVMASAGLLLAAVALLLGGTVLSRAESYSVVFSESVSGLEIGAPVKLSGVRVGRVEDIRVDTEDPGKVIVDLGVRPGTPIKEDTRAVINSTGLTGLRFVELVGGSRGAESLHPPARIQADLSLMAALTDKADLIARDTHRLLQQVVEMTSPENQRKLDAILAEVAEFARSSNDLVESSETSMQAGLELLTRNTAEFAQLADQLQALMEENRQSLRKTTAATEQAVSHLAELLGDQQMKRLLEATVQTLDSSNALLGQEGMQKTMEELNQTLASVRLLVQNLNRSMAQNVQDFSAVLQNLERTLANLEEFTRTLKDQPSAILGGRRSGRD